MSNIFIWVKNDLFGWFRIEEIRDNNNEIGLKEEGGIEMSNYSAFHIRDARSPSLLKYLPGKCSWSWNLSKSSLNPTALQKTKPIWIINNITNRIVSKEGFNSKAAGLANLFLIELINVVDAADVPEDDGSNGWWKEEEACNGKREKSLKQLVILFGCWFESCDLREDNKREMN